MITANRRARATIAFFIPRCLAIFIAQALSQDHFVEWNSLCPLRQYPSVGCEHHRHEITVVKIWKRSSEDALHVVGHVLLPS
jgi:hypothetical protein